MEWTRGVQWHKGESCTDRMGCGEGAGWSSSSLQSPTEIQVPGKHKPKLALPHRKHPYGSKS